MSQISSTSLRVGFAGTPDFAALILRQLLASAFNVVVVYTQPDRPAGRRRTLTPSAVKTVALEHHLELRQPQTWKHADTINELASFDLDVLAVAAYGLILPARALSVPRHGCINVHASVLPRWRGAAPIERAIMAGDEMSGVSIMQMDEGLDTGPVFTSVTYPIGSETSGAELEGALADLGGNALLTTLMSLPALDPAPQSAVGSCYAEKLTSLDARIDWTAPAVVIHRQIRALCGRMPAFTFIDGSRLRILAADIDTAVGPDRSGEITAVSRTGIQVGCGTGSLRLTRVQLNRGKGQPVRVVDAINGYPGLFVAGLRFQDEASQQ
ncbi:MAG: methionyl-tRNA formyltransferase [Gammaproteobacteria bacterium]|nr:methionyl-tRNA formyltransferase [Gammaproteobacteria bacterium]